MKKLFFILLIALASSLFTFSEAQYTVLYNFNNAIGAYPVGDLTLSGNKLYGMTALRGPHNAGCIFSIDTNGNNFKVLLELNDTNGNPSGSLTLSGKTLYGMTMEEANNLGTIFSIDTDGSNYKSLFDFTVPGINGAIPWGSLTLLGNVLYGMTEEGGAHGYGNIFSIDTDGSKFKNLFVFNDTDGALPFGSLTLSRNVLYGMTCEGGISNKGVVFSIDTNGSHYKVLIDFNGVNGVQPKGSLILFGNVLYGMTQYGGTYQYGNIFSIDTNGNNYKDLLDFNGTNGGLPFGSLTFYRGVLFGMTKVGGANDSGNIFSIDTNGNNYKNLFNFNGTNGGTPEGSLIFSENTLYGMAFYGGIYNYGVVFNFKDESLGINEMKGESGEVKVYPNPSNGIFQLEIKNEELGINNTIEVYNMLGEKVYSHYQITKSSNYQIDLSGQPNGVYLYRVITETGSLIGEGKLVIQK